MPALEIMKKFVIVVTFFNFSHVCAETIYQWSDPWGQVQYSKTPVPGAMVSDLTELPAPQETTEQQKQEAMVRKLQKMRQDNIRFSLAEAERQAMNTKELNDNAHCEQLRNLMFDVQLANIRQYSLPGFYLFPGYFGHLQMDLSREIREKCR